MQFTITKTKMNSFVKVGIKIQSKEYAKTKTLLLKEKTNCYKYRVVLRFHILLLLRENEPFLISILVHFLH